jgi:hypothetical protein
MTRISREEIYRNKGYIGRRDYLECLATYTGVELDTVLTLASMLGRGEDFDGLVTALEDLADGQ